MNAGADSADRMHVVKQFLHNWLWPHGPQFSRVMENVAAAGESLSIEDITSLHRKTSYRSAYWTPPIWFAEFVVKLLADRHSNTLLDPFASDLLFSVQLVTLAKNLHIDAVSQPQYEPILDVAQVRERIRRLDQKTTSRDGELRRGYDAIVSLPPIGQPPVDQVLDTGQGEVHLRDEPPLIHLAALSHYLDENGIVVYLVPPRFEWDESKSQVRGNLGQFGLYLSALLRISAGALGQTTVPLTLALFERKLYLNLFVAEIPEDSAAQDELIERLIGRQNGPSATQGRVVDPDRYRGFDALLAEDTARRLAENKGLQKIPFATAVLKVRTPRRGPSFEPFADHPDAVYLPEMAKTDATTSQAQLPERLQSYFQLIVDPNIVRPEYLANLFNTPLGHAFRRMAMRDTTIPRISPRVLQEIDLYLPPLHDQNKAVEALTRIQTLRNGLGELEAQIWDKPRGITRVLNNIQRFNNEERFKDWMESLPFPLATILALYQAEDRTPKEKYERLLHFFEALAAFCATIHLSACFNVPQIWPFVVETVSKQSKLGQPLSLDRPTFGLWRMLLNAIAPQVRKLVHGSREDEAFCQELYCVTDKSPLEALCSKQLLEILERANTYRNRWTGHGGAITVNEASQRLEDAKSLLDAMRSRIGSIFLDYELIELQQSTVLPGPRFKYEARRVMGSNPILDRVNVELVEPLESGKLCFHAKGQSKALALLPLVRLQNAPQTACYFYNRIEHNLPHFVTYHVAAEPEIEFADGISVIQSLKDAFDIRRTE